MAQMIRAILLARATAASLRGLRSSNCSSHAEADLLPGLATRMTDMAPTNSNCLSLSLPALLILPRRCLPPVECSFGVRPSQAAKWRPDSNFPGSTSRPTVIAPIGPTPGISARSPADRVGLVQRRQFVIHSRQFADPMPRSARPSVQTWPAPRRAWRCRRPAPSAGPRP